jgi:hypothetical protein
MRGVMRTKSTDINQKISNPGPNIVHPSIPGAVGSLESQYRMGRDTTQESKRLIEDICEKIKKATAC